MQTQAVCKATVFAQEIRFFLVHVRKIRVTRENGCIYEMYNKRFHLLTIFTKISIMDACQVHKFASVIYLGGFVFSYQQIFFLNHFQCTQ